MAEAVPAGAAVVDVGAGDGQLAAWLASSGHRVIATEGRPGPLLRLCARLSPLGIDCRAGDGLAAVEAGEVQAAVLAGMGGRRIIRLLSAARDVVAALDALVLQPVQHVDELRVWAAASGFEVTSETEVVEGGRRYTVLLVRGERGSG